MDSKHANPNIQPIMILIIFYTIFIFGTNLVSEYFHLVSKSVSKSHFQLYNHIQIFTNLRKDVHRPMGPQAFNRVNAVRRGTPKKGSFAQWPKIFLLHISRTTHRGYQPYQFQLWAVWRPAIRLKKLWLEYNSKDQQSIVCQTHVW